MSSKLNIRIDIGQRTKLISSNSETAGIKDANGEVLIFNSIIDALNFMSANGYEFVTSNIIVEEDQNVYYYLMKKKRHKNYLLLNKTPSAPVDHKAHKIKTG